MSVRPWLILSIGLNLFLAASLYVATRPFEESLPPAPPPIDLSAYVRTNVVVRHENFTWPQVESTNYVDFVKNLRAIACPEQTIRDIIASEVGRSYAHRKLTDVTYPNYEWWRSDPDPEAEHIAAAKLQSLELERHELLTSILGPGWDLETKEAIAARGGITLTGPVLGEISAKSRRAALDVIAAAQLKIEAYLEQRRLAGSPLDPMQMVRLREEPLVTLASIFTGASSGHEPFGHAIQRLVQRPFFCSRPAGLFLQRHR